ncbi:MAG: hypothetical protein AABX48_02290 [Nanoarchaeota archaeon]
MKINPKLGGLIVTILLIGTMLVIGPVQAFTMNLSSSLTQIVLGQKISFLANVVIDPDEEIDPDFFVIDLAGPLSVSCTFTPEGKNVSSCKGIHIELFSNETFGDGEGYGYGYGYGSQGKNMTFNITIDTTNFPTGTYSSELIALAGENNFSTEGPDINVNLPVVNLQRCSVRANDGEGIVNNQTLTSKIKLNFNIPNSGAATGKGSLISQGSERFVYDFEITRTLENKANRFAIETEGTYKVERGVKKSQNAIITIYKNNQTATITADDFTFDDLQVTLLKGC